MKIFSHPRAHRLPQLGVLDITRKATERLEARHHSLVSVLPLSQRGLSLEPAHLEYQLPHKTGLHIPISHARTLAHETGICSDIVHTLEPPS